MSSGSTLSLCSKSSSVNILFPITATADATAVLDFFNPIQDGHFWGYSQMGGGGGGGG